MVNYILRRLLLMIPTVIGITLLVFMLVALSPGGIGASLNVAAGGTMQSQNAVALQRARMEDRFGLNESVVVQYVRWLERVCPIKFGQRDLISPQNETITKPRAVPTPPAWRWYASSLPALAPPSKDELAKLFPMDDDIARAKAFKRVESDYITARAQAIANDVEVREAIKKYVEGIERRDLLDKKGEVRFGAIDSLKPDPASPLFATVELAGKAAIDAYTDAANKRELLIAGMRTKPYPEAGLGLIPGVLSVAWPDLGVAFSRGRPVLDLIRDALPVTLMLNLVAFPIIYMIAIPSGMLAAIRRGTVYDVGLGALLIGLFSVPVVLAGVLAQGVLANPDYLGWFPTAGLHSKGAEDMPFLPGTVNGKPSTGWLLDHTWHMVLPVACILYGGFAVLSKQTRAAMLENFNADYVRTAKAKGVAPKDVVLSHVFRNSLLPLITMFVTIFPAMLAGSVVIERIFSIPGMGSLLIEAITLRDRELILANTMMVAIVNLLALLLADILYALADPRIAFK